MNNALLCKLNKFVTIIVSNWWYRGKLDYIGVDYLKLTEAHIIETPGAPDDFRPKAEACIGTAIINLNGAVIVDTVWADTWCPHCKTGKNKSKTK